MTTDKYNPDAFDEIDSFAQEMVNKVSGNFQAYGTGNQQVTLRLDHRLVAQIDAAAKFCDISRTQLVARLVHDAFEDFDAAMLHHFRHVGDKEKAVEYVETVSGAKFGNAGDDPEEIEQRKVAWFDQDGPKGAKKA